MATQYTSDRQNSNRPVRTAQSASRGPARPAGAHPSSQRPAPRTGAQRPQGARPSGNGSRRPANRRRRKPQGRFYAIIAIAAIVLIALVLLIVKLTGGSGDPTTSAQPTAVPSPLETTTPDATPIDSAHADVLAAMLGSEDGQIESLDASELAQVDDLSITQGLDEKWMNILLLGSDERKLSNSARTDSMIICSIHLPTGQVKLTSIMRDLAVDYDDIGKYNGTYRINAANYFGGERLAMKTVNERFGMNIDKYVRVNFYGFQQVAQILGGIDITISEAEMQHINKLIVEQAKFAYLEGIDESALPNEYLETYGENTHLDGRQTLAYARIRKLDSDFGRAERQRKVLTALMHKVQEMDISTAASAANEAFNHLRTNMTLDEILAVGMIVMQKGITNVETFRLPVNDSYVQETRNNQSMFYDCDWAVNASQLHTFIYG